MTVTITSRGAWGARRPVKVVPIPRTPRLWLHHTVTSQRADATQLRSIQAYHMDGRGWNDIAYSFLVGHDGSLWEGRGALVAGGHTEGDNSTSHAICAIGDWDAEVPPADLLESIAQLTAHGFQHGWWPDEVTGGHREAPGAQTACPGRHLQAAIPAINRRVAVILAGNTPTPAPTGDLTMAQADDINTRIDRLRDGTAMVLAALSTRIDRLRDGTILGHEAQAAELDDIDTQIAKLTDS